jgi:DNA repair protein RecN (Recombination protein N)
MLTELHIYDFALVRKLALAFGPGLNVLTGETGAGKSIIIDAIGSILGDRSGPEFVRGGADRARVDATFLVDSFDSPASLAEDADEESESADLTPETYAEEGLLLISRDITRAGRSTLRMNGKSVTLAMAREITRHLADMHGQHEHQSLLAPDRHVEILDRWIGRPALHARDGVADAHREWSRLQRERSRLLTDERERSRRLDLLKYQTEEIRAARLKPGEEETLQSERSRLAGAEKLFGSAAEAMTLLSEKDENAVEAMSVAVARLRDAQGIDPTVGPILETLETALFSLEDAVRDLSDYRENIEFNPERLAEVEERIDLLRGLKRKYGDSIEEILAHAADAAKEIDDLERSEERSQELDAAIQAAEEELKRRCARLSDLRRSAAPELETALMRELADLSMERTRFRVQMDAIPPGPLGAERVEFLLSANPGEPLKPLAKIASGGELSRIMLALKSVTAQAGGPPLMIFDEIDVGVGGRTGSALAAKLRALGDRSQALCVTHLPQIAAAAHRHFSILKVQEGDRTIVEVREVTGDERITELARMLGGSSDAAVEHAKELLKIYDPGSEALHA